MTHIARTFAFDYGRNRAMFRELTAKINSGFDNIQTMPQNCVSANYDMVFKKYRYSARYNRRINPYRLGFDNPFVKTHFNFPYEVICITEAQKYLNSRMSSYFPDWQSRFYEQHGHNSLDIFLDTQRPMLIDVNIRELAKFVEIVRLEIENDIFGSPCKLNWVVRHIENSSLFDKYMSSGKQDSTCYDEEKIIADYNVFDCYDSQSCKPKFYMGHFDDDIDYKQAEPTDETKEAYIKYLLENDDELPENFYVKRRAA